MKELPIIPLRSAIVRLAAPAAAGCLLLPRGALAAEEALAAGMDTVWLAVASALVFFMQAGFALVESGLSRAKNSINVLMKNYIDLCVGTLAFWVVGYGLMFGSNPSGWFGTSGFLLNDGEPMEFTLLLFQAMFAATAVTIASGAMAERTRFVTYAVLSIVVTGFIYPVYGSWVWGGGWLAERGFVDFAGSTVVHSVGGWCALAGVLVLGPRLGRFDEHGRAHYIAGHHLPQVALGGFVLWLGWFGFNGGSTASADVSIGLINLNTHLAAASGVVGILLTSALFRVPLLLTSTVNGALGGLVAITAGCATMRPGWAIVTGLLAGALVIGGSAALVRLRIDDVVGAIPVHGLCGAWGTLAAGMFHHQGLFDPLRIETQLIGIGAALAWALPTAWLVFKLLDMLIGLRVSTQDEMRGLDYAEHYEVGYPEFGGIDMHAGKSAERPR